MSSTYLLICSEFHFITKQGVAVTGRNTTGPPRAAPGELRCICAALQTTDDDIHQRS